MSARNATVIYAHSPTTSADLGSTVFGSAVVWRRASELLASPQHDDAPAVVLVDLSLLKRIDEIQRLAPHIVVVAVDAASARALDGRVDVSLADVHDPVAVASILDAACKLAEVRLSLCRANQQAARTAHEFRQLNRVGMALMHERDRSALIALIVDKGKELTESDGGGLLLLETNADGVAVMRVAIYGFDSVPEVRLPIERYSLDSTTVVGHAALTKEPVIVDDSRHLPPDATYRVSSEFQRLNQYHGRSLLAVPMLDQREAVLGVLFFVNHKSDRQAKIRTEEDSDRYVLPYTDREVRLARSLASQAAMAIENTLLYAHIEDILESTVRAAVTAIDERDPTTAGHSLRVATLTTALAEAVVRANTGSYRNVRFTPEEMRELRFAALLHDLGKVTVREDVLRKANKLPSELWERVNSRFDLIHRTIQLEHAQRSHDGNLAKQLEELDRARAIVRAANQPSVMDAPAVAALSEIAARTYRGIDGSMQPYLTGDELHYLQIARGTLDEAERAEIELHVAHTNRFLSQIPWTEDLKNLVAYAYGHHEKLNGSGYPQGLHDKEIPLQTRMLTLADMFDALTEADRPYKPAVSPERALEIIQAEANSGLLDRELVEIMVESKVYRRILPEHAHGVEMVAEG